MTTETQTSLTEASTDAPRPTLMPAVDVFAGPEDVRLVADLPGAAPDDVRVCLEGRVLSIEADAASGVEGPVTYRRRFTVGADFDADGVRAEVRDGVLSLHLPRSTPAGPRRIAVNI